MDVSEFDLRNEIARREEAGHDARVPMVPPKWAEHLSIGELRAKLRVYTLTVAGREKLG